MTQRQSIRLSDTEHPTNFEEQHHAKLAVKNLIQVSIPSGQSDFVAGRVTRIVFSKAKYESFDAAVRAANEFVSGCSVKVLNVATVVLTNVWKGFEGRTTDPSISIQ
jgi:hypothetical protein